MRTAFRLIVPIAAVTVAALLIVFGLNAGWFGSSGSSNGPNASDFQVTNATDLLGPTFAHGAPQAFAFNGSAVLVTGVVGDPGPATIPFPLFGSLGGVPPGQAPSNLSGEVAGSFHGGDTLGAAWNGTAWLVTGEAAWGAFSTGAAAAYGDGRWANLTPVLGPYFADGGGSGSTRGTGRHGSWGVLRTTGRSSFP